MAVVDLELGTSNSNECNGMRIAVPKDYCLVLL